ncbi:GroES-like protein [Podospora australis]|uniref:GroES-like protein n=1 Tax=Podospora australis TaxID=1536484 RepID=A0AAN7ADS6_9PEZI|nr:GroES-like protein [Podospora australis]
MSLPTEMKAIVLPSLGQPLEVRTIPVPTAIPGSVVIKVLAVPITDKLDSIVTGRTGFTFPKDMIPSGFAIGRVAARGPDTTAFKEGQLVMVHSFIRARDDPDGVQALWGAFDGPNETVRTWFADNWKQGTMAEYVRAPLENTYALDEDKLTALGYTPSDLLALAFHVVAIGGLKGINFQAGERIIVAPATGQYGGATVHVALAMGAAQVIAMGRNLQVLKKLQAVYPKGKVEIVPITGDVEKDTQSLKQWGPVDSYLDISPPAASGGKTTHIRSAFATVRPYGRISIMGMVFDDIAIPYGTAVWNNLTIRGQYMYERADVKSLLQLVEGGVLTLGKEGGYEVGGAVSFEELTKGFELAAQKNAVGDIVAFVP